MIRHLLKLVWHRRNANLLVVLEIFACFLIVFGLAAFALFLGRNSTRPLGYDWTDVWAVTIDVGVKYVEGTGDAADRLERLLSAAEAMPEVTAVAVAEIAPLEMANIVMSRDGVTIQVDAVSDSFAEVMDLEVVAGRWFGPQDDGLGYRPAVIDRDLARALWGEEDPVGRSLPTVSEEGREERVIGVIRDFRKDGELSSRSNYLFHRARLGEAAPPSFSRLVLEMAPGADAEVEERLVRRFAALAPDWTFSVTSLERLRANQLRFRAIPLLIGGVVVAFLLVMVGLGLSGVLWQSITQRTGELGLRRALGASRGRLRLQVLLEILLLAALAVGAGLLVVVQLPLFEVVGSIDPAVFTGALALAVTTIFALAFLCGLYPSRLAMQVEPADALRND